MYGFACHLKIFKETDGTLINNKTTGAKTKKTDQRPSQISTHEGGSSGGAQAGGQAVEELAAAGATRRRGGEGHDRSAGRTGSIGPRARGVGGGHLRAARARCGAARRPATEQGSWQSPFTGTCVSFEWLRSLTLLPPTEPCNRRWYRVDLGAVSHYLVAPDQNQAKGGRSGW